MLKNFVDENCFKPSKMNLNVLFYSGEKYSEKFNVFLFFQKKPSLLMKK
jgi:hypothetical protein